MVRYYKNLFDSSSPSQSQLHEVFQHVSCSITSEFNESLLKPYTKEEIHVALLQMHPCKAPGPDGIHVIFNQKLCHIVGNDVTSHISDILDGLISSNHVNRTNIALIPKVKSPTSMVEFRHISLCNLLYELVTKTLVTCLKHILPHVVSENCLCSRSSDYR